MTSEIAPGVTHVYENKEELKATTRLGDLIPDRLSIEQSSPFYNRKVGNLLNIDFKGIRQMHLVEYCISEGWVRRYVTNALGQRKQERGKYVILKLQGEVIVAWKEQS